MPATTHTAHPATSENPTLSTLLSQLLVAFTIEFDNEAEERIQHWTTASGAKEHRGVWLTSMVMWANVMRLVPEQGISVGELQHQARTINLQLNGLERWGYIAVAPRPEDPRPKPSQRDWLVRPTTKGRAAEETWRPLGGVIEARWRERFGEDNISRLRMALAAVLGRIDLAMPEYLPILTYGLFSQILVNEQPTALGVETASKLALSALLAKTLLAFTLEFESEWKISLPIFANALQILHEKATRLGDLPQLSGVSREAVAFATGWLDRAGCVEIEPDPAARGKVIRLTLKGRIASQACLQRLTLIEKRWKERFGEGQIRLLQESLQAIVSHRQGDQPTLSQGLMPYPNGWRASKRYLAQTLRVVADPAANLPRCPMVLHRGGYPDGS